MEVGGRLIFDRSLEGRAAPTWRSTMDGVRLRKSTRFESKEKEEAKDVRFR